MPGLVTASFLDQIAKVEPLPEREFDLPTRRVQANGTELHYFEFGRGEPVVFVHGSSGDYRTWAGQFEAFSAHYRVIAYSRRYHYPNSWTGDGSDYNLGLHTDDLAAFIEALGLGAAHLVGVSWGASIAAQLASFHPQLARTLVLDEPEWAPWSMELGAGEFLRQWHMEVEVPTIAALAAGENAQALRMFYDAVSGAGTWEQLSPERRALAHDNLPQLRAELQCGERCFSPFSFDDARNIAAPTLIVEGGGSLPVFALNADKLAQCVPYIERATIAGVPHPTSVLAPDQFNEVALSFLRRHKDKDSYAISAKK
jgi:pimeloyl-ACP methyl ester carboxylesterase